MAPFATCEFLFITTKNLILPIFFICYLSLYMRRAEEQHLRWSNSIFFLRLVALRSDVAELIEISLASVLDDVMLRTIFSLIGPRQPRQVLHLRQLASSVQPNGTSVAGDVTDLPAEDSFSTHSNSENCQRHNNADFDKSGILDPHQRGLLPGDTTSSGQHWSLLASGHLVTVWTPSLQSQSSPNTRSMNARIIRRKSCDDRCDEASKDHQAVETKT